MNKLKVTQTTWDLSPLYKSDDDPKLLSDNKKVEQEANAFINHWKNNQEYLEKPEALKAALDEYENFLKFYGTYGSESYYFHLRTAQDQINSDLKAKANKIEEKSIDLWNKIQFFTHTLSKVSQDKQKFFLKSTLLTPYHHFLERIFAESKYLLSEPEEKIMNLKSGPSYSNWVKMTSTFLSKEEKQHKTLPIILSSLNGQKKKARDMAAKSFNQILEKYSDVAEVEINSVLENKKIDDELRGYTRPDQSRHISDDIKTQTVDSLIEAVAQNFDIAQKYYQLKTKLLGQKKLAYHERNVPIGKLSKRYNYQQAVDLVYKVFQDLDSEFSQIFKEFVENGQIDVSSKKGKRDGAFCSYGLIINPTYILLNHSNQLNDVLTLAHEVGHGINNELIKLKQNSLNFGTPTSTAEVASTFTEDFVLNEILKNADDELRLSVLMTKLNDDVSTIFRQIACYKFEQDLHKNFRAKGYLSKAEIGKLFVQNMSAYMGSFVEQSEGSQNWWVYWSHIRMYFYNYSYASGLLISKALQAKVKKDSKFITQVKEFLATGLSDSPQNIFLKMGIDISQKYFWDEGLSEIRLLLTETEKLAKRLKKI